MCWLWGLYKPIRVYWQCLHVSVVCIQLLNVESANLWHWSGTTRAFVAVKPQPDNITRLHLAQSQRFWPVTETDICAVHSSAGPRWQGLKPKDCLTWIWRNVERKPFSKHVWSPVSHPDLPRDLLQEVLWQHCVLLPLFIHELRNKRAISQWSVYSVLCCCAPSFSAGELLTSSTAGPPLDGADCR